MSEAYRHVFQAGNRALAKRDYPAAKAAFEKFIAHVPGSVEGYLGLAKVLERTHAQREIVRVVEPVVKKVNTGPLLRVLADAYRVLANQGDEASLEPAIAHYQAYVATRKDAVSLFYLGELYREHKRDFAKAMECFRQSWLAEPGSGQVRSAALACSRALGLPGSPEWLDRTGS